MANIETITVGETTYDILVEQKEVMGTRTLLLGSDVKNTTLYTSGTYSLNDNIANYSMLEIITCMSGRTTGDTMSGGYSGEMIVCTVPTIIIDKISTDNSLITLAGYGERYCQVVFPNLSSITIVASDPTGVHRIYGVN